MVWTFFAARFDVYLNLNMGIFHLMHECWFSGHVSPDLKRLSRLLPVLVCWTLWRLRMAVLYNDIQPVFAQVVGYIQFLYRASTLKVPVRVSQGFSPHLSFVATVKLKWEAKVVCWLKPPTGVLKLNVDGSSVANATSSGGGILLRDSNGYVIFGIYYIMVLAQVFTLR